MIGDATLIYVFVIYSNGGKILKNVENLFHRYKLHIALMCILITVFVLIIGCVFLPEIFFNGFVWKYYVGPIIADAEGYPVNGVKEGYNIVNTLTYGIILFFALWGIYRLLQKLNIRCDFEFILSLIPFIIFGGISRSLEDAFLFEQPIQYLFISPIIYFFITLIVIVILIFGLWVEKKWKINVNAILFLFGFVLLMISVIHVSIWLMGEQWIYLNTAMHPFEIPIILGLASLSTFLVFIISKIMSIKFQVFKNFLFPMNVLLFFSHFLDASATYRAIDFYGYGEKHLLPSFLISFFGSSVVLFAVKLIIIVLIIYLLDIGYRDQLNDNQRGLIKLCILILGLAPGIRDMIRLAMGA